jgi:chromosome segregation ATPase
VHKDHLHETLAVQQSELEQLRLELARRDGHIDALEAQVKVRSGWDEDLRQTAANLDAQLLERDKEIAQLRRIEQSLREEVEWRRETEDSLRQSLKDTEESLGQAVERLQRRLATVETTRLWRVGTGYWRLKDAVRRALRRGAP